MSTLHCALENGAVNEHHDTIVLGLLKKEEKECKSRFCVSRGAYVTCAILL